MAYQYVPAPQPQMYVSASPQGGNIMQLPNNVQYIPQVGHHSPGHIVSPLPGGQLLFQPQQHGYYPTTPIMPIQNTLPAQYTNANPEPKVHYGLAVNTNPLVYWDIFQPTSNLQGLDATYPIQVGVSAVEPPVNTMRLVCKDMPWIITIKKSAGYVSISDVFEAIYTQMQEPIIHSEWRLMGSSQQKKVTQRFRYRNELLRSAGKAEDTRGIRRVDYCLNKVAFVGLKHDDKAVKDLVGDIDISNAWILVLGERR